MAISTNPKPTIYRNLYENTGPEIIVFSCYKKLNNKHDRKYSNNILSDRLPHKDLLIYRRMSRQITYHKTNLTLNYISPIV